MLRWFPAARFAYNAPLLAERRLLRASSQNGPGEPGSSEKKRLVPFGVSDQEFTKEHIEKVRKSTEESTKNLVASETDPDITETLQSEDTAEIIEDSTFFNELFDDTQLLEDERFTNLSAEDRESVLRTVLNGESGMKAALLLAQLYQRRAERYEELLQLIESKLSVSFGKDSTVALEKVFGESWKKKVDTQTLAQLEVLQEGLSKLPSETLAHLLTIRTEHEMQSIDRSAISTALNLAGAVKEYENDIPKHLTPEERAAVESFIIELEAIVHKKRKLGLKESTLNDASNYDDQNWQQSFVEALHDKKNAARKLLLIKLRKEAKELLQQNDARRKKLVQELHLDQSISEEEASRRSLARFGVGYDALVQTCFDADIPALEVLGELDNGNLPPFDDEKTFLHEAATLLDKLRDARTGETLDQFLAEERTKQQDAERWFNSVKGQITQVLALDAEERRKAEKLIGDETWMTLKELSETGVFYATDLSETNRQTLSRMLDGIIFGRDTIEESITRGDLDELPEEGLSNPEITSRCLQTRTFLRQVLDELLFEDSEFIKNELAVNVNAKAAIDAIETDIITSLDRAEKEGSEALLNKASMRLRQLEACKNIIYSIFGQIIEIDDDSQFVDYAKGSVFKKNASFKPDKDRPLIVVRTGLPPEVRTKALEHEKVHAIAYALRKSGVAPLFILPSSAQLQEHAKDGRTFLEILDTFSKRWGIEQDYQEKVLPKLWKDRADQWKTNELFEEFMLKHAEWIRNGRPQDEDADLLELFSMMVDKPSDQISHDDIAEILGTERRQIGDEFNTDEAEEETEEERLERETAIGAATGPTGETENLKQELVNVSRNIAIIKNFRAAYFDLPGTEHLDPLIEEYTKRYDELDEAFLGRHPEIYGDDPEENSLFKNRLKEISNKSKKISERVREFDVKKLDITQERKTQKPGLFEGLQFLSILDFQKLIKDTMEDIKTMYGRNQERKIQNVGETLFAAADKGKNIPFIGSYLGKLKGYHTRRYSGAELESVNKWKDGLENEDSHTLLHMFPGTSNKDQIRAMITLLTDRGEMDWNDPGVMRKLGELSGYRVPIEACLRDDVLRDTWYRKMVTEIWKDKELYYQWRGSNDDKTESGKKHFTTFVDQLSNVGGGMRSELAKQLRLFVEWKKHPHGGPPEDVKPHLYEEVIHYAIRDGKMTMEQKFYYLVRGVAEGILSIDRLRALAGEHGGVLNQFPFIDFFYQKNNSLPEVQALAKRLIENDDHGNDTFNPGVRTTLWLHLEVSREKSVQERLSKGTSKTGAEDIDHEDIPFFITQLDYNNGVRNLADVISGSRQKVSPEGWKNAYVGFSSKLKIFGRLAQMEEEGLEKLTAADSRNLAQTIAAYIDMDNILTRNGSDKDSRPTLSEYQLDSAPVSGDNGKHTTRQYRETLNTFIGALMREFGPDIEQDERWKKYHTKTKVTLSQYAPSDGMYQRNEEEIQKKVAAGTPYFVGALQNAIMADLPRFKRLLASFTEDLHDEGGSDGQLGLENVRAAIRTRKGEAHRETQRSHPGSEGVVAG